MKSKKLVIKDGNIIDPSSRINCIGDFDIKII